MKKSLLAVTVFALASTAFAHDHDISGSVGIGVTGTTSVGAAATVNGSGASFESAGIDAYSAASISGSYKSSGASVSANEYSGVTAVSYGTHSGDTPVIGANGVVENGAGAAGNITTTFNGGISASPAFNGWHW